MTISVELIGILAKRGRIEMIRTLKAFPDKDFTINELARTAGVPTMTAWRATKELKKVGFVKTRKVGNATSVCITDDHEKLRTLRLVPETDPQRAAAILFAKKLGQYSSMRSAVSTVTLAEESTLPERMSTLPWYTPMMP